MSVIGGAGDWLNSGPCLRIVVAGIVNIAFEMRLLEIGALERWIEGEQK